MISDDDIDRALAWLVKNADAAAEARAHRVLLEESCKSLKAQLMKQSKASSVAAQEVEALSSPEYAAHLEGLREAVYQDERYRLYRSAAEARIEAWRTMAASARSIGKVG